MTPPATSDAQTRPVLSTWALQLGVPFAGLAGIWFFIVASGRIDTAKQFESALRLAYIDAAPLAVASLFLVIGITRRFSPTLRFLCVAVAVASVWILGSQLLRHAHSSQLRLRLRTLSPVLMRPNTSLEPTARAAPIQIVMDSSFTFALSLARFPWLWLSSIR